MMARFNNCTVQPLGPQDANIDLCPQQDFFDGSMASGTTLPIYPVPLPCNAEHFASQTWSTSTVSLMIESFVYPQSCASKATSRKYLPLSRNLLKSQQTSFLNPVYSSRGGREQDVGVIAISTVSISLFFFVFFVFVFGYCQR